jgi:hypothetical protein
MCIFSRMCFVSLGNTICIFRYCDRNRAIEPEENRLKSQYSLQRHNFENSCVCERFIYFFSHDGLPIYSAVGKYVYRS